MADRPHHSHWPGQFGFAEGFSEGERDAGGCTLNFSHNGGPTPMTGIYVLSQNAGNVWDDTGAPIPKPQQHD